MRAAVWYSVADDGLAQSWHARRLWLNPPYSDPAPWTDKLIDGWQSGSVGAGIAAVRVDGLIGRWGERLTVAAALVCLPWRRIAFIDPAGTGRASPSFGVALVAGGPDLDADRGAAALSALGSVWRPS